MTTPAPICPPVAAVCPSCGFHTVRGVCTVCGYAYECILCGRVQQPDGAYKCVDHNSARASHGVCPDCGPEYRRMFFAGKK